MLMLRQLASQPMTGRWVPVICAVFWSVLSCTPSQEGKRTNWSQWQKVPNDYADHFEIWTRGSRSLLLVFGHGGKQDTVGKYWVSLDGDTDLPPVEVIRIPVELDSIALTSTTHVPFVTTLGHVASIRACAHLDQVRDVSLRTRVEKGEVKEIASGDGIDRETLLVLKPQALFGYPFGQSEGSTISRLGIPVIEVSEYLEEHPLGRAEWLRVFGVLLGEEQKADSLFDGIKHRYEAMRIETSSVDRPTVLFGSVWDGQWWVPPGNSYMARLIEDAGGQYLFADRKGSGNIAVDMETMVLVAKDANYWGMVTAEKGPIMASTFTGGDTRLKSFKAAREHHLFVSAGESDFFGKAMIEPDVLLQDLICSVGSVRCPQEHMFQAVLPYFTCAYYESEVGSTTQ